jgi:hypothetical protein
VKKEQEGHIKLKAMARYLRNEKKEKARKGENISTEFDLHAVLYCLKSKVKYLLYN